MVIYEGSKEEFTRPEYGLREGLERGTGMYDGQECPSYVAYALDLEPKHRLISSACSILCIFFEPVEGLADSGRETTLIGHVSPSPLSSHLTFIKYQPPMFFGSS